MAVEANVTDLLSKLVRYSTGKDTSDQGIVMSIETLPEGKDKAPITHYAILTGSGEIKHVAAWRINGLVSGVKYNMLPILAKNAVNEVPQTTEATSSNASDELPF